MRVSRLQFRRRIAAAILLAAIGAGLPAAAFAQAAEPDGGGIRAGVLPKTWPVSGPTCPAKPEFVVHAYNDDLLLLRESGCSNYEKPFLFLLFGKERALLLDTGAGETDVVEVVDRVMAEWSHRRGRAAPPLVVAHTHAHGDHTSGDAAFRARAATTVVDLSPAAVQAFFGFRDWPATPVTYDLGDRVLDIIAIPGHEPSSIAVYDRSTAVLFTGDTLYPGRLYVRDAAAFSASVQRLVDFTDGKLVAHILGNHIEERRTPFLDYTVGTVTQPDEHALELGRGELLELNAALRAMQGNVRREAHRDFTIWPK
jgi:glyoxylase-like metal-dependent hydrolase (beta-lactamase superfamily II)